ncbi:hypothetical protein KP509_08G023300 [Ceratopteris richardii]|uniref:AP2/ERF domain-containing protein n=1 Tax=Ceratopteris richardii TaxID=49495 RepID=A0A8T2U8J0_CERRI|nr:hypothetical protein KP509_08G023300 [Ceratopteris richardii]
MVATEERSSKLGKSNSSPTDSFTSSSRNRFKGVRMRSWGKWVSEIRLPNCRDRLWLGSFSSAEQAARAFDVSFVCLQPVGVELSPDPSCRRSRAVAGPRRLSSPPASTLTEKCLPSPTRREHADLKDTAVERQPSVVPPAASLRQHHSYSSPSPSQAITRET